MSKFRTFAAIAALLTMASTVAVDQAEAKKKKKPVAEAPPPPLPPIPQRPYAPNSAPNTIVVPQLLPNGLFISPNRNISPAQTLWNLRSAYNVAALNCSEPARTEITTNYRAFLRAQAKPLSAANRSVDAEFRRVNGSSFVRQREAYMTQVYNYFALPPTMTSFCNAILVMSREAKLQKPTTVTAFAQRSLPNIDIVFDDFFHRYGQYKTELAAWDAQWYDEYFRRYGVLPYGPPKTIPAPPPVLAPAPVGTPGPAAAPTPVPVVAPRIDAAPVAAPTPAPTGKP